MYRALTSERLFAAMFAFCFVSDAHAYVDPGSSFLLLQGLLAVVGGILIFLRNPVVTIRNFLQKFKKNKFHTDSKEKTDA